MTVKLLVTIKAAGVKEEEVAVLPPLQSAICSLPILVSSLEGMFGAFFLPLPFKLIVLEIATILEPLGFVYTVLAVRLAILQLPQEVSAIREDKSTQSARLPLAESAHEQRAITLVHPAEALRILGVLINRTNIHIFTVLSRCGLALNLLS
jgi:hypothetical protein